MSTTTEPGDTRSSGVTYMGRRPLSTGKIGYAYADTTHHRGTTRPPS